ncbi:MAG: aminotransferase class V-fold PLP-dependent enzyme [Phycisphaerales bacterium]|nr:aminotransferase class V-fold PLP-dependent enzyme [Phycisphaerales bacterium]
MSAADPQLFGVSGTGRTRPAPSPLAVHWRLDPGVVFLNHGSFGACPTVVIEKQREIVALMEREPVRFFVELLEPMLDDARRCAAEIVGADAEGIAFVSNATSGVNTVLRSLTFKPGDELLTNTHEYNACNNALRHVAERFGARVVSASPPFPVRSAQEVVAGVLAGVTSRTKLVMLSHVTSPTGMVMPIGPIVEELTRCGIDTLIDGAHAPGMIPLDIRNLGCTYYTGNFHKWMCTPKGSAFLWVREDKREMIRPLTISHGANATRMDRSRYRLEFDYVGTFDASPVLCLTDARRFLSTLFPGGLTGLMEQNRRMALEARRVMCKSLGVDPPCPESMIGTLAAVPLPNPPGGVIRPSKRGYHDRLWDELIERHGIQIPIMPFPPLPEGTTPGPQNPQRRLIRISMQAYNAMAQVDYLMECLREELMRERATPA